MELLVLSLPDDNERRARLEASLSPYGLDYHWIKAVDARGWSDEEAACHLDHMALFFNMSYHPIPGSIGCYRSHLKAYEHLLLSDKHAAIILEDDAEITEAFASHLSCLESAAHHLDVIFLCDRRPGRPAPLIGQSHKGLAFTFKRFANIGANGYVINRKAARLMIDHYDKFGLEIDTLLNRWWQTGLSVATTAPELVTHKDMGSSIGYDNIRFVTNPFRRLANSGANLKMSLTKRLLFQRHLKKMQTDFEKGKTL
ncbi:MAG: glycosyltransferase family 25 protein [Candidatus Puniceispirillaceae bacterium]